MSDIGDWASLVCIEKVDGASYVMVPLNIYQIGNLLDALSQVPDNGDWWGELQDIIGVAMRVGNIEAVESNSGKTFTRDQVLNRAIR